ncbi:response regulator transcription factor [Paenibacillus azoreducens]|uniref:DNA-binding response regulator n=1 Tax=Paenibacillus azoreducens TaxID=116718 RepID=A0A920CUF2_9BACL|nr:response regulator transcription factor [Paenibacillus azoreducens]GIO49362.1 DNA-binding response regulator [Paenibacillus azoreducens]
MTPKILYIEDDDEIGSWLADYLSGNGYAVKWLKSANELTEDMLQVDLVILDVMLTGLDGYSVGNRIRKRHPSIPIMMLTARTSIEDKLQGLAFADDYMTKPFHPDELCARIKILLRRKGDIQADQVQLGHMIIDKASNRMTNAHTGEDIVLTGKQYHIFMELFRNANRILTKKRLFESVWGEPYFEGDKTLMVHIRHLREKIEIDPGNPVIIETIRGVGYRVKL